MEEAACHLRKIGLVAGRKPFSASRAMRTSITTNKGTSAPVGNSGAVVVVARGPIIRLIEDEPEFPPVPNASTITVWLPSASGETATVQLPVESAVVWPRVVPPSVSLIIAL